MNVKDIHTGLSEKGFAIIPQLVSENQCAELKGLYDHNELYRSTISMERYRFGQGEYKYFAYPLPAFLQTARETLYEQLVVVANEWRNTTEPYPPKLSTFIDNCHTHGQTRPTPLILKYEKGGYNTLHQDLYGDIYFPFQVLLMLSQPGVDFDGGEFVIIEQRPRAQSKANVIRLRQGDALVFTTHSRPVKGTRGYYRAPMKHGISEVTRGRRHALGIIFHDAR
jgi:hypothetical protein